MLRLERLVAVPYMSGKQTIKTLMSDLHGITNLDVHIFCSDKPGSHDFNLLKKLVLPDGSILRAKLPGRPTRDCLFSDPARDGKRLDSQLSTMAGLFLFTKSRLLAESRLMLFSQRSQDMEPERTLRRRWRLQLPRRRLVPGSQEEPHPRPAARNGERRHPGAGRGAPCKGG